jgi:hypothetical protein
MLRTEWIARGAFVVPYGTMSAVELSLTDIMDKVVVDDWGQCKSGQFGSLRAHVEAGKLSERTLHAELGEIVAGRKPGRERDDETILLWHRGLSLSDIALGAAMLDKAKAHGDRPAAASTDERQATCSGCTRSTQRRRGVARAARNGSSIAPACRRRGHRLSAAAAVACVVGARRSRGVFMCGYPFSRAQPQPIARRARSEPGGVSQRTVYWTCIVVRATAALRTLRDTLGIAWRTRRRIRSRATRRCARSSQAKRVLFAMVGPLVTPRRVVEAVAGEAEPVRSTATRFDLMRLHEPRLRRAAASRRDSATPIPCWCLAGRAAGEIARLRGRWRRRARAALADARPRCCSAGSRPSSRHTRRCASRSASRRLTGMPSGRIASAALGENESCVTFAPRRGSSPSPSLARPRAGQVGSKNFTEQFVLAEMLCAGARGRRHQGRAQDQPRRHADRAQGARGKADRPLSRVHGHDAARGAEGGADDRPQGRVRQGQGRVRDEGPRRPRTRRR